MNGDGDGSIEKTSPSYSDVERRGDDDVVACSIRMLDQSLWA